MILVYLFTKVFFLFLHTARMYQSHPDRVWTQMLSTNIPPTTIIVGLMTSCIMDVVELILSHSGSIILRRQWSTWTHIVFTVSMYKYVNLNVQRSRHLRSNMNFVSFWYKSPSPDYCYFVMKRGVYKLISAAWISVASPACKFRWVIFMWVD